MAGICGFISKQPVSIQNLVAMHQKIAHRGRDDRGILGIMDDYDCKRIEINKDDDSSDMSSQHEEKYVAGLGFHRNIPGNAWSKSPIHYEIEGKKYYTVFDGILYINDHLTEGLGIERQRAESMDPVALITLAYHTRGLEMLQIADGSYAFAIFDEAKKELIVFRDKLGTKPLYYWYDPYGNFFFASEIKAFTGCSLWKSELNKQRAIDYLVWGRIDHTSETLFDGVMSIVPGQIFVIYSNKTKLRIQVKSYGWKYEGIRAFNPKIDETSQIFRSVLFKSIHNLLKQKGGKGIALSGGLDSSSILMIAEKWRSYDKKLKIDKTFSACSEDKRYDEKYWIDGLLKNTSAETHFTYPQGKDIFSLTENIVYQNDEPYFSQTVFLSYHIYKSAAENGIFSVLNGSGADAIIAKNNVITLRHLYLDVVGLKFMSFWKKLQLLPNKKEYLIGISKYFFPNIWGKIGTKYSLKNKWGGIIDFYLLGEADQKSNLPPILNTPFDFMRFRLFESPLQRYLKTADRCAHTFGVEVYFPYINQDVVNELTLVPPALKFDKVKNKQILISGVGDLLPEIILNRQSKGHFTTAEESWFLETNRKEFIEFFKKYVPFSKGIIKEKAALDYLTGMQSGKIPFNTSYWRLICFCVWMKVFDVQISEKP